MNLSNESQFFHAISKALLRSVGTLSENPRIAIRKEVKGDFATNVDIEVEDKIISMLNDEFPTDLVLAEEGFSDTDLPKGRIWIIDPICGTTNLSRGMKNYCTNIALADNGKLIASCVIDYSDSTYFWSVGDKKIYREDSLIITTARDTNDGILIDIDLGAATKLSGQDFNDYSSLVDTLMKKPGWMMLSLNSSLSFLYAAIGRIDCIFNVSNEPWDVAASVFLLQQNDGIATDLSGEEWEISSNGMIFSLNRELHKAVLDSYTAILDVT